MQSPIHSYSVTFFLLKSPHSPALKWEDMCGMNGTAKGCSNCTIPPCQPPQTSSVEEVCSKSCHYFLLPRDLRSDFSPHLHTSLKPLTSRKQFLHLLVQGRVELGHKDPVSPFLDINEGWQDHFTENLSSSSLYLYCSYLIKYSHQCHRALQYNLQQYVSFCHTISV